MNDRFFFKFLIGLAFIAVGVLFLLNQIGVVAQFDYGYIFSTYWPVIMILFGLRGLFFSRHYGWGWAGSAVWNLLIIALGAYFQMRNLDVEWVRDIDVTKLIFPGIIILIGLSMLFPGGHPREDRDRRRAYREYRRANRHKDWMPPMGDVPPPPPPPTGKIGSSFEPQQDRSDDQQSHGTTKSQWDGWHKEWSNSGHTAFKGGVQHRSSFIGDIHFGHDYWELTPINASNFIGDTIIDLTRASIPNGETKINISSFIGDVKLFVPNDMQVEVRVTSSAFLGDVHVLDRREGGLFKSVVVESPFYREAEKRLRVNVSVFIGDVIVQKVG